MLQHGTALEWFQVLVATGCLLMHVRLVRLAHADYVACCRSRDTSMHRIRWWLRARRREELFAFAMACAAFAVGLVVASKAPPPGELSPHAIWKLWGIVTMSTLLLLSALYRRRDRRAVEVL